MATLTERLALLISADVKGAVSGLNEVGKTAKTQLGEAEKRIDKVGRNFTKVGTGMLAVGGAAAVGLYKTVDAASDLKQSVGGTEAVFKDASKTIDRFAKDAARSAGLSERAFREATTSIGGNLKRMGFSTEEAAEQSADLTQVAADLAATYGGTTAEAVQALGAAFRGEADPAERFNLNLKASAVSAKAVELGLAASTQEVDEHARAQGILALIAEQSADAQGQFAREAGSAAGSAQIAAAEFENAKAALGESLAPVMADAAGLAADLFAGFSKVNEATGGLASKAVAGVVGLTVIGGAAATTVGHVIRLRDALPAADTNLGRFSRTAAGFAGKAAALTAAFAVVGTAVSELTGIGQPEDLSAWRNELELLARTGEGFNIDAIVHALDDVVDQSGFERAGTGVSDFIGAIGGLAGIEGTAERFRNRISEVDAALAGFVEGGDAELAASAFEQIATAAAESGIPLDEVASAFPEYAAALDLVAARSGEAAGPTDALGTAIGGIADEAGGAKKPIEEYSTGIQDAIRPNEQLENAIRGVTDAMRGQFDPVFAVTDALLANQDAQRGVEEAERARKKAVDDLNGAIWLHGEASDEAKEAAWALEEADLAVDAAQRNAYRSALDVTAASTDLAGQMRAGKIDWQEAEAQIRAWADQGLITEAQARAMKDEMNLARIAASELDKQDVTVEVTADTTKFWQAIADLYSGAASVPIGMGDAGGPVLVPEFDKAEGGFIPGPKGKPVFGIAHGGEYVLTTAEVDAMRRGGAGGVEQTTYITINNPVARAAEDDIVNAQRRQRLQEAW